MFCASTSSAESPSCPISVRKLVVDITSLQFYKTG
jgi:hypothetical protein